ncbi:hypothetical protein RHGRI_019673 [Rhododendron griersonianum]|uniref:Uncharacterized protein n=1 Tax=Rhododendron griersonianum TaxID=479676 RepID=A0AAV6JDH7_9ERIC|nr:hypothetical protein RHGRI_019673 [Rhododendron griersonianum]
MKDEVGGLCGGLVGCPASTICKPSPILRSKRSFNLFVISSILDLILKSETMVLGLKRVQQVGMRARTWLVLARDSFNTCCRKASVENSSSTSSRS